MFSETSRKIIFLFSCSTPTHVLLSNGNFRLAGISHTDCTGVGSSIIPGKSPLPPLPHFLLENTGDSNDDDEGNFWIFYCISCLNNCMIRNTNITYAKGFPRFPIAHAICSGSEAPIIFDPKSFWFPPLKFPINFGGFQNVVCSQIIKGGKFDITFFYNLLNTPPILFI